MIQYNYKNNLISPPCFHRRKKDTIFKEDIAMKREVFDLENGAGVLFTRNEFILCKPKHQDAISCREKFHSEGPAQSLQKVEVPYNAECIVCCFYEDGQSYEWSIQLLQNGHWSDIERAKGFSWDDDDEDESSWNWKEKFDALVASFLEKGYERICA